MFSPLSLSQLHDSELHLLRWAPEAGLTAQLPTPSNDRIVVVPAPGPCFVD